MNTDYEKLESNIGYCFKDKDLLINALTHTSYANEHKHKGMKDNERLEFLGDAVLELVSSEYLYKNMKDMPEGKMTRLRASLVCEGTETGGRKRDSIVSDAFEALIGAIFLDGGIEEAKYFILKFALNDIEKKKLFYDSKTVLQERVNSVKNGNLVYEIIKEWGPDHNKTYEAAAKLNGKIIGKGQGHTKKAAEQQAAFDALKTLDKRN